MPPVAVGHEEQADQRRAALALLDTLIQENVQVALPVIKSVAGMFPAQSMLLIQRVSPKNSKATLIDWVFNRDGMYSDPRSRAAAMILAKTPDSAFVYRILDGLQLHITLFVIPPNMGYGKGGSTFGCGLGLPPPPSFGWPKVYDYALQDRYGGTGREDWNRTPVAELAEHWVSAERFEENRGPSWCSLGYSEGSSGDGE